MSHSIGLNRKADQDLRRLTFHGFPKVLDLLKKELFGICSPRFLGKGNVDLAVTIFS
jgi:hypothetical protein